MVELVGTGKRALEMVKGPCFSEHVFFWGEGDIHIQQINKSNQPDFWERSPNGIQTAINEANYY